MSKTPKRTATRFPLDHALEDERGYIDMEHDYLWVGKDDFCFGHLSGLRQLRAIHERLGEIIRQRARLKTKGRKQGRA